MDEGWRTNQIRTATARTVRSIIHQPFRLPFQFVNRVAQNLHSIYPLATRRQLPKPPIKVCALDNLRVGEKLWLHEGSLAMKSKGINFNFTGFNAREAREADAAKVHADDVVERVLQRAALRPLKVKRRKK